MKMRKGTISLLVSVVLIFSLAFLSFGFVPDEGLDGTATPSATVEETKTEEGLAPEEGTVKPLPVKAAVPIVSGVKAKILPLAEVATGIDWDATTATLTISDHVAGTLIARIDALGWTEGQRDAVENLVIIGGVITGADWNGLWDLYDGGDGTSYYPNATTVDISQTNTTVLYSEDGGRENLFPVNSVESVILPPDIEKIGDSAFDGFRSLHTLVNIENVERIGIYAFYSTAFRLGIFPSVGVVDEYAFASSALSTAYFPQLRSIHQGAFGGCESLKLFIVKGIPEFVMGGDDGDAPDTFGDVSEESILFYTSGEPEGAREVGWVGSFVKYIPEDDYRVTVGSQFTVPFLAPGEEVPELLNFSWAKDGTSIPGATQGSYPITAVRMGDAGAYAMTIEYREDIFTFPASNLTVTAVPPDEPTPTPDETPPTVTPPPPATLIPAKTAPSQDVKTSDNTTTMALAALLLAVAGGYVFICASHPKES